GDPRFSNLGLDGHRQPGVLRSRGRRTRFIFLEALGRPRGSKRRWLGGEIFRGGGSSRRRGLLYSNPILDWTFLPLENDPRPERFTGQTERLGNRLLPRQSLESLRQSRRLAGRTDRAAEVHEVTHGVARGHVMLYFPEASARRRFTSSGKVFRFSVFILLNS